MTNEKLYEVLGSIDEKYVKEAREYRKAKKPVWLKWGAMAACLCLVVVGALLIKLTSTTNSPMIISQYDSISSGIYPIPEPGEYYCLANVNEAREYYANQDVRYLLAFNLFKNGEEQLSEEEKKAEYQRLIDLGYQLYETERWTYRGESEKVFVPVVVGLFTEEDLVNFNVNPAYGYSFHFVSNGDGSSISINENNLTRCASKKVKKQYISSHDKKRC